MQRQFAVAALAAVLSAGSIADDLEPAEVRHSASASDPASNALNARILAATAATQPNVVRWRRDIHQHPELSEQEVRTAKIAADHLRALGFEVRTGIAKTGVLGILRGGKPGATVALRADMDALPVEEQTGLPFASKVKAMHGDKLSQDIEKIVVKQSPTTAY